MPTLTFYQNFLEELAAEQPANFAARATHLRAVAGLLTGLEAPTLPELNGLTSVPCAVGMDERDRYHGWLFIPHADGQWVTATRLDPFSLKIIEHWKAKEA
jgi:hypothetical protein